MGNPMVRKTKKVFYNIRERAPRGEKYEWSVLFVGEPKEARMTRERIIDLMSPIELRKEITIDRPYSDLVIFRSKFGNPEDLKVAYKGRNLYHEPSLRDMNEFEFELYLSRKFLLF